MKIKLAFIVATLIILLQAYKSYGDEADTIFVSKQQAALEQSLTRSGVTQYYYRVIRSYPHLPQSFTEGLVIEDGFLYESVGLYKQSALRKINIANGKVVLQYALPARYFAEGLALMGDQLYQLTYLEKTGFVYDKKTFALKQAFQYPTEGWGLTSDDHQLIMSNGSATLFFIDPHTFKPTHHLVVKDAQHQPIPFLNELEYINGHLYANVWPTNIVIIISPKSGQVEGWVNLKALNPYTHCKIMSDCVANGIAYDKKSGAIWITGKNWPYYYVIVLSPSS